jgi:hypothetical protein
MAPDTFQFILHDAESPGSQQQARAHAARVAHSRKRQFRLIEYQAGKKNKSRKTDKAAARHRKLVESRPSSLEIAIAEDLLIPSPVSQLASDRTDPFASLARSLTQDEHFLFDYCAFELAITNSCILSILTRNKSSKP